MKVHKYDSIVTLGGGLNLGNTLPVNVVKRLDTAIAAWAYEHSESITISGGHNFMLNNPPIVSEASVMEDYIWMRMKGRELDNRIDSVFTEEKSLDTIGNALFTKTDLVLPNNWERLMLVTSRTHLSRAWPIFEHVMGPDIKVVGVPAPEVIDNKLKRLVERSAGALIMREVLRGTKPGDHQAIEERLFNLVPGYDKNSPASKQRLAELSLLGIVKFS